MYNCYNIKYKIKTEVYFIRKLLVTFTIHSIYFVLLRLFVKNTFLETLFKISRYSKMLLMLS